MQTLSGFTDSTNAETSSKQIARSPYERFRDLAQVLRRQEDPLAHHLATDLCRLLEPFARKSVGWIDGQDWRDGFHDAIFQKFQAIVNAESLTGAITIMRNNACDTYRMNRREPCLNQQFVRDPKGDRGEGNDSISIECVDSLDDSFEEECARHETLEKVLAKIQPAPRNLLERLRRAEPREDIAKDLGLRSNALEARISRALKDARVAAEEIQLSWSVA